MLKILMKFFILGAASLSLLLGLKKRGRGPFLKAACLSLLLSSKMKALLLWLLAASLGLLLGSALAVPNKASNPVSGTIPLPWALPASGAISWARQQPPLAVYQRIQAETQRYPEIQKLRRQLAHLRGLKNQTDAQRWNNDRTVENHIHSLTRQRFAVLVGLWRRNQCENSCERVCARSQERGCSATCAESRCGEVRAQLVKAGRDLADGAANSQRTRERVNEYYNSLADQQRPSPVAGQAPATAENPDPQQRTAALRNSIEKLTSKQRELANCNSQCLINCRNRAIMACRADRNLGAPVGDCSSADTSHCTESVCNQTQCARIQGEVIGMAAALMASQAQNKGAPQAEAPAGQSAEALEGKSKSPVQQAYKTEKKIGALNVIAAGAATAFGVKARAYYVAKNYPMAGIFAAASGLALVQATKLEEKKKKIQKVKLELCEKDPARLGKCVGEPDAPPTNYAEVPGCPNPETCRELDEELGCIADPTGPGCAMPEYCEGRPEDPACAGGELADCHNSPESSECQTFQEYCGANPSKPGCSVAQPHDVLCRVLTPQAGCHKNNPFKISGLPPKLTKEQQKELDKYTQKLNQQQAAYLSDQGLDSAPDMTASALPASAGKKAKEGERSPGAAQTLASLSPSSSPYTELLDPELDLSEDDTAEGRLNRQMKNRLGKYYSPGGGAGPGEDPYAGKSVDYNGEVVGVAQDNIFLMVHRRYRNLSQGERFYEEGDDGGR